MSTTPPVSDPWLDPFTNLGRESYFEDLSQIATEITPDGPSPEAPDAPLAPIELTPEPTPTPEPVATPEPEPTGPKVFDLPGGGRVTMERTSKGWTGVLDQGSGAKQEVFYGATKDDLIVNVLRGKLEATKKIKELNGRIKLGNGDVRDPAPVPPATPRGRIAPRELNAEDRFEFKTRFDADPVAAMDFYNEKRYGMTPEEFANRLNKPIEQDNNIRRSQVELVASQFVTTNQDYYPDPEAKNYLTVVRYLTRQYLGKNLGRNVTSADASQAVFDLYDAGHWTIEDLEEAKDDLIESGLLLSRPVSSAPEPEPAPVAAPTPQAAPQPPVDPQSIPAPTTRTRAGNLGLRPGDARIPVPVETPLPDDDPNRWSDDEVDRALSALKASRLRSR